MLEMYGDLTTQINKNNAEISMNSPRGLMRMTARLSKKQWPCGKKTRSCLAIASGGLDSEGKINKALMAIGGATPEEITNFAKGYNDIFGSMTEGYTERGKGARKRPVQYAWIVILPNRARPGSR